MRAWKQSGGNRTYYFYDGTRLLYEMTLQTSADDGSASWQVAQYYGWGVNGLRQAWTPSRRGDRLRFRSAGERVVAVHRHAAAHGRGEAAGARRGFTTLTGSCSFGDRLEAQSDAVGYNGQWGYYTDIASIAASGNGLGSEAAQAGLVLCTHRYYSPDLARWLTRDPMGYDGGINVYAYCEDNPVGGIDPMGLWWTAADIAHFLLATGGGIGGGLLFPANPALGAAIGIGIVDGLWAYFHDHKGGIDSLVTALTSGAFAYIGGKAMEGILSKLASWGPFQEFLDQLGCNAKGFFKQLVSRILQKVGCFVAGTPVQIAIEMTDASPADRLSEPFSTTTKPIEQIKIGDSVVSRDAATGKTSAKRVTATKARTAYELVKVSLADAAGEVVETIQATPEHPFYVQGKGFTPAGRLAIGNSIVTRAGPALRVKELGREARPDGVTVYNLTVEDDHTYFVGRVNGGMWVHNICRPFFASEKLTLLMDYMFRGEWIGGKWVSLDKYAGGLAGAVRRQLATGELVGGADHLVKGRGMLKCLADIIRTGAYKGEVLSQSDLDVIKILYRDLAKAFETGK